MRPLGDPEVIEYVPAKRSSGAAGRFIKLCLFLALALGWFAWHRSGMTDAYASDGALVFGFIAFCFAAMGVLVAIVQWVRTGRF